MNSSSLRSAIFLGLGFLVSLAPLSSASAFCLDAYPFTAGWGTNYPPNGNKNISDSVVTTSGLAGQPATNGLINSYRTYDNIWSVGSAFLINTYGFNYYNWSAFSGTIPVGYSYLSELNPYSFMVQSSIHVASMEGSYSLGFLGNGLIPDQNFASWPGGLYKDGYSKYNAVFLALGGNAPILLDSSVTKVPNGYSLGVMTHRDGTGNLYLDFYSIDLVGDPGNPNAPTHSTLWNGTIPQNGTYVSEQGSVATLTYTASYEIPAGQVASTVMTLSGADNAIFLNSNLLIQNSAPTGSLTVDKGMVGQNGAVQFTWAVNSLN